MRTKVLWCSESSTTLSTGYAVYSREIIKRLNNDKDIEIAEFASYVSDDDPRIHNAPWKIYPNIISSRMDEYNSKTDNEFGAWLFEEICLQFKPHIVCSIRDHWMDCHIYSSPYRNKYHWIWMPTVDSYPQNEQWLSTYINCDSILAYQDWSKELLKKEGNGLINVIDSAPPSAESDFFPINNRLEIKKAMGLENMYIVGTVMRNQRRKLFPDLFESFRQFLDITKRKDVYLYCHTSYPDMGWDIPKLLIQHGIASKTLFSYICKNCGESFPHLFSDAIIPCIKCGKLSARTCNFGNGVSNKILNMIYNMFDVYVQYANSEGFGVPQVEAAACGVPIMSVDFSGMSDVVRKLKGIPIKVLKEYVEVETGCHRAIPDNKDFINKLIMFFDLDDNKKLSLRKESREAYMNNYGWDKTANVWRRVIKSVNNNIYDNAWKEPPDITPARTEVPNNLSNTDFARFLILEVLREPSMVNTYTESRLIKDLNYGYTTGAVGGIYLNEFSMLDRKSMQEFDRQKAYSHFKGLRERKIYWEKRRCGL